MKVCVLTDEMKLPDNYPGKHKKSGYPLHIYKAVILIIWTMIIVVSITWNIVREQQNTRDLALMEARIHFNKDQAFRSWAALHGGVYVTPTEKTPPESLS
jgi:hypothetical protein